MVVRVVVSIGNVVVIVDIGTFLVIVFCSNGLYVLFVIALLIAFGGYWWLLMFCQSVFFGDFFDFILLVFFSFSSLVLYIVVFLCGICF